eukprot:6527888-Prymnesium_polylepis.2
MLVAHTIESLLAGKPNLLVDEGTEGAPAQGGQQVLQVLLTFVQATFAKLSEKAYSREFTPLQALLETANCALADFPKYFGELSKRYAE